MTQIGKYNIDDAGFIFDNGDKYSMIILSEFKGNTEIKRKVLYFLGNIPEMKTEDQISELMKYKEFSKISVTIKEVLEIRRF